jgi:hypothetical protein
LRKIARQRNGRGFEFGRNCANNATPIKLLLHGAASSALTPVYFVLNLWLTAIGYGGFFR